MTGVVSCSIGMPQVDKNVGYWLARCDVDDANIHQLEAAMNAIDQNSVRVEKKTEEAQVATHEE